MHVNKYRIARDRDGNAFSTLISGFTNSIDSPVMVVNEADKIIWHNEEFENLSEVKDTHISSGAGKLFAGKLCFHEMQEAYKKYVDYITIKTSDSTYAVRVFPLEYGKQQLFGSIWYNRDEIEAIEGEAKQSSLRVAYIVIDNSNEVSQEMQENRRFGSATVNNLLHEWADKYNAVLIEYDRDKYVMHFENRYMDQIVKDPGASSAAFVVSGSVPGLFWGKSFAVKTQKKADATECTFTLKTPVNARTLTEKILMKKDVCGFAIDLAFTKLDDKKAKDAFRWHPELATGGSVENGDAVFYPAAEGAVKVPLRGVGTGQYLPAKGDWTALVDTNDLFANIYTFDHKKSLRPYIWDAAKFHTVELECTPFTLKKGESKYYSIQTHFVRGLEGIDAWKDLTAIFINIPVKADQKKLSAVEVKAGTAFLSLQDVTLEAELLDKNGKKAVSFSPQKGTMIYEKPFTAVFKGSFSKLPDGTYTVKIRSARKNGKAFTAEKKVTFAGQELERLTGKYKLLVKKVEARKDQTSRKTYELRIALESLRRSLALADTLKAADEIAFLEKESGR